ncbi:glycoside hydrolase family 3 N-terminal domain-containing protein [Tropicimonas sp. S265A]|uniref:glycoside hydrolase family 3 N-terminal domain-containing protein n=1 Tax=Tropicimonas sp. S265A TaxID=3415134 RepID=UPI003C7C7C2C
MRPYILGCAGLEVSDAEKAFFREAQPWGFILFARNVDTPQQLRTLCATLRDSVGWHAPILIDQEGGRVARMRGPHWREHLPPLDLARCADPVRAFWLRGRLLAEDLRGVGIDVNCVPMLDIVRPDTHPILKNRCYGADPATVAQLGRTLAEAHMAGGVLPVMKHMPGHGLSTVDSHLDLPRVTAAASTLRDVDFQPFSALSDLAMAMSAHVVFEAFDPARPATQSPIMISMIREELGFSGLLMTDDISMQALSGSVVERAQAALAAGCDMVLHCNGDLAEMQAIAGALGPSPEPSRARAQAALAARIPPDQTPTPVDIAACAAELEALERTV